ncbi:MAG TPA: methyltransferase domain-containing protein [Conexibacter sp.]|nr:methyltransferase domain-containing protein [Conexibacter sp.]
MKSLTWDYTSLAHTYRGRPPYAETVIDDVISLAGVAPGDRVCDIGAGTGHLSVHLVGRGLAVDAVEPNAAMREVGRERLDDAPVDWFEAQAEETGRPDRAYRLVTFGSSFNVVEPGAALAEAARILARPGWVALMWNHRDLDDPLQTTIEAAIASRIPGYDYGARRSDPSADIEASGRFHAPRHLHATVHHEVDADDWVEAWSSHATLARQAGDQLERIIDEIAALVAQAQVGRQLTVPYTTRCWVAAVKEP